MDYQRRAAGQAARRRLKTCPRCKQPSLDINDCGESQIYRSRHLICNPCWHEEDAEIEREGTNDLPDRLRSYGSENDDSGYD